MITQIKNIGTSKGIIIPTEFLKYMDLDVGDWINITDVYKVKKGQKDEDTNL